MKHYSHEHKQSVLAKMMPPHNFYTQGNKVSGDLAGLYLRLEYFLFWIKIIDFIILSLRT